MGIFKRKPTPLPFLNHPTLGLLRWSEDENGWFGQKESLRFCIMRESDPEPEASLLDYAASMLSPPDILVKGLTREKEIWREKYPKQEAEIDLLAYEKIDFYQRKGKNRTFASLGPGADERAWRIAFAEKDCEGLGFDS